MLLSFSSLKTMRHFLIAIYLLGIATLNLPGLFAKKEDDSISRKAIESLAIKEPSQESPFFLEREEAKQALARAATNSTSMMTGLPPRPTVQKQVKQFFSSLVSFIKLKDKKQNTSMQLFLEPSTFSVTDTPELTVTFKATNFKKDVVVLEFPTSQRFDILLRDASGRIIYRWSEDRSFEETTGMVAIDPKESVVYTEKIPTSMMSDGKAYSLEVSLLNQPGYSITEQITPHTNAPETNNLNKSDRDYLKDTFPQDPLLLPSKNN